MSGFSLNKKNFLKFLPGIFLTILTLLLMFYFKSNKAELGEIVNKGTNDLLTLYTENLKPLLFGTDINNEDVFNFALYQTLPIDKEANKVLLISESNGNTNYEVIPSSYKAGTDNYQNFVKYMNFNNNQKVQLDSILNSYQAELAEAVLTDGKNTVAVNSRLISLQKAVLTDIAAFAQSANKTKVSSLFGVDIAFLDSKRAMSLVDDIKNDTSKDYIIISGDTAFTSRLEFNIAELMESTRLGEDKQKTSSDFRVVAMADGRPNIIVPQPPKILENKGKEFSYSYSIPDTEWENFNVDKIAMDSLRTALSHLKKELNNISFSFDSDALKKSLKFDLQTLESDTLHNLNFEFNFENLGQIINKSLESVMASDTDDEYWEKFGKEIDSLAQEMVKAKQDSIRLTQEELKNRLEQLKRKDN